MASLKGEIDRFSSVSSLYGPGTVGSWLCIVASVFVSWTLNAESRRRDTISNDFIAMLSMALVAAGHVSYLLLHSQQSDLFTNTSPEATLYASSVEAPLNVCETFSVVALALFPIAGLRATAGELALFSYGTFWLRNEGLRSSGSAVAKWLDLVEKGSAKHSPVIYK